MSSESNWQAQLIAVQELVMHLQHEFEQVHQVVLAQADELASLRRELGQMRDEVLNNLQGDKFPTPAEDRPPHY